MKNQRLAHKLFVWIGFLPLVFMLMLFSAQEGEQEVVIPRSVEGEGIFINSVRLLIDGQSPPEGSAWDSSHNIYWEQSDTYFIIDLGGEFFIHGILLQVDGNDNYRIDYSLDGLDYVSLFEIREDHGDIASGMDTMSTFPEDPHFVPELEFEPLLTRFIRISAQAGDSKFAMSEVQIFGERGESGEIPEGVSKIIRPVEIMGTGEFENDANLIIDGRIPFEESAWDDAQNVYWMDADVSFVIDLGQIYEITGIVVQVDTNDDYRIEYSVNGDDYVILTEILSSDGEALEGMDTMSSIREHPEYIEVLEFFPLRARYIRIFAANGDDRFSIS
ncbi:MAG: hypothetical protein PVI66_18035, partial [Candidatus Aminicenantes bacterium]